MARVIIGVDPHKRSATIEIVNEHDPSMSRNAGIFSAEDHHLCLRGIGEHATNEAGAVGACHRRVGEHHLGRLFS
ncbi:hypothetical protein KRM28CT15_03870 [Krasilnikovia sp. M28-CT-15]